MHTVTEILYTAGVTLVGPLPSEFELATVYRSPSGPARRGGRVPRGLRVAFRAGASQVCAGGI